MLNDYSDNGQHIAGADLVSDHALENPEAIEDQDIDIYNASFAASKRSGAHRRALTLRVRRRNPSHARAAAPA